jgi:hypothetical protein
MALNIGVDTLHIVLEYRPKTTVKRAPKRHFPYISRVLAHLRQKQDIVKKILKNPNIL